MRLPRAERIAALRDAANVERMVNETGADGGRMFMGKLVVRGGEGAPQELVGRTLEDIADARGEKVAQCLINVSLENDLLVPFLAANVGHQDADRVGPLLAHPLVHVGASDGGAHVTSFSTYGDTGFLFSRYVRETHHLSLEHAIKKITSETAEIWGLKNRGSLQQGYAADVVVFDADRIDRGEEHAVFDMPGKRHALRPQQHRCRHRGGERTGRLLRQRLHEGAQRHRLHLIATGVESMNDVRHRIVASNGIRLHVAEAGSGPVVLLIHGFPESWYSWRYQLPALAAAGYHAVALDVRGYGRSSKPTTVPDYRMVKKVGDVVGLVAELGGGPVTVVGHDWGAPIAWMSALLRPDLFRGVAGLSVPYAPPAPPTGPRPTERMRAMAGRSERILRRVFPAAGSRGSRDRSERARMVARFLLVRVWRRPQRSQHFHRAARNEAAR